MRDRCANRPGADSLAEGRGAVIHGHWHRCRILYNDLSMTRMVPFTEARGLSELLDDEILQDEEILDALRQSEKDVFFKAGRLTTLDEVRRALGLA